MKQDFDYLEILCKSGVTNMKEYFDYLEILRKSGVTNMFGAAPYLEQEFGLDRREARTILKQWMVQWHSTHRL
jgi:hypothetical protein